MNQTTVNGKGTEWIHDYPCVRDYTLTTKEVEPAFSALCMFGRADKYLENLGYSHKLLVPVYRREEAAIAAPDERSMEIERGFFRHFLKKVKLRWRRSSKRGELLSLTSFHICESTLGRGSCA